jgi:hypothetical protein
MESLFVCPSMWDVPPSLLHCSSQDCLPRAVKRGCISIFSGALRVAGAQWQSTWHSV